MTGADLLTRMQVLDNDLDVSSGGADETTCLSALDMAQDMLHAVVASEPRIGQTAESVATVANTEKTTWPTGLMRIDRMFKMDTSLTPARQAWEIDVVYETGGHRPGVVWPPLYLGVATGGGAPRQCYAVKEDGLYWGPGLPDAVYTCRLWGFVAKTAIATRATTFGWSREVSNPIVALAGRIKASGLDDPTEELKGLAAEWFSPVVKELRRYVRSKPEPRKYSQMHTT